MLAEKIRYLVSDYARSNKYYQSNAKLKSNQGFAKYDLFFCRFELSFQ